MSSIIAFPGTEAAAIQNGLAIARECVAPSAFFKIVDVSSWRHLMAVAECGGIRSRGRISIRPNRHSKTIFAEWGFEFYQVDSSDPDVIHFKFEIGSDAGSLAIPMSLRSAGRRQPVRVVTCPRCHKDGEWYLYCAAGYGWGCSDECFGFRFFDRGTRIMEEASTALLIDVDEKEHSVEPDIGRQHFVEVTRLGMTKFFDARPDLYANIPGVFSVHIDRWHKAAGHFVADPRQLPVIESKNVQVFDGSQVQR